MLAAVEDAIFALLTGVEEMQINGRKYRKSNLDQLKNLRQELCVQVFYENLSLGGTTRAYAAWPQRKGGIPPWTSVNPSTKL